MTARSKRPLLMADYEIPPEPIEPERPELEVSALAAKLRIQQQAREMVQAEAAAAGWAPPWEGQPALLSDALAAPRVGEKWIVDRLMGANHNVVLAAQYGAGKTTLGLNLVRSLVDGRPFLGREVAPIDGRVGWINGEMDLYDWADYARPMGIKHPDRVAAIHLREGRLPLLNDHVSEQFAKWCRDHEVSVLMIDSWRKLCMWSGLDENVNAEVERLTGRIDEFKKASGVRACLILAHTGRAKADEGEERVRGATALDDWADARWIMTRQDDARQLRADKRGVEMTETNLLFDPATNRLSLGEGNRHDARAGTKEMELLLALNGETKPVSTSGLAQSIGMGKDTGPVRKMLLKLEKDGVVHRPEPQPQNGDRWALKSSE